MIENPNYSGHNLSFIVGCPRSGTTWLQRLLLCHPKVHSGQETDLFDMFIGPQLKSWRSLLNYELSGRPVGLPCYFREHEYLAILRRYMLELLEPMIGNLKEGEIFVEKTPSHALFIPEIMEMLPESRIIHILRDPRDVVASLLAASKSWGKHWAPKDATSAAHMWVQHVQAVQKSSSALPKDKFYELRYEDLCASTEGVLNNLCQFLGLEWDEAGLKSAIAENEIEIAEITGGTNIPIGGELASMLGPVASEPQGFIRKDAWEKDLSREDITSVLRVAGPIMVELGYYRIPFQ